MSENWSSRVAQVYAAQVTRQHLEFVDNLVADSPENTGLKWLVTRTLATIGQPTESPEPFGDIYFLNGRYHIGQPDTSYTGGPGYFSKELSGELAGGRGKVLAYLVAHVDESVHSDKILELSGWKEINANMAFLINQMDKSDSFTLERNGPNYTLKTKAL